MFSSVLYSEGNIMNLISEAEFDDELAFGVAIWWQLHAMAVLKNSKKRGGSRKGKAPNTERNFVMGHRRILLDYFWPVDQPRDDGLGQYGPVYSEKRFERRFRIPREIFNTVFQSVAIVSDYLRQFMKPNCVGKLGASPLQKVVAAFRQLAYDASPDSLDEYCRIGESTSLLSLKKFCRATVYCFGSDYLRSPSIDEIARNEAQFANVGFPGCMGMLDCAGWEW